MLAFEKTAAVHAAKAAEKVVPRWMNVTAAAKYSGMSRAFLYQLMGDGQVRVHKVRGCRLIDRLALDELIAAS